MDNNDDWLYDSIKNYSTLNMYDLQMRPRHLVQIDPERLCLAGKHPNSEKTEILCLRIPEKLFLRHADRGRCKHNDFEIDSGRFVDKMQISSLGVLSAEKVIAAVEEEAGLTIYNLNDSACEKILNNVHCDNFDVNRTKPEILATTDSEIIFFDVTHEEITKKTRSPVLTTTIECRYVNQDILAFIDVTSGSITTYDRREEKEDVFKGSQSGTGFKFATDYHKNRLISINRQGNVFVFDTRYPGSVVIQETLKFHDDTPDKLEIRLQSDKFSISGVDNSVYVFHITNDSIKEEFRHLGHNDECSSQVTDHLWLPHLSDRFLVSCADNGSLNCWEYVENIDNCSH